MLVSLAVVQMCERAADAAVLLVGRAVHAALLVALSVCVDILVQTASPRQNEIAVLALALALQSIQIHWLLSWASFMEVMGVAATSM